MAGRALPAYRMFPRALFVVVAVVGLHFQFLAVSGSPVTFAVLSVAILLFMTRFARGSIKIWPFLLVNILTGIAALATIPDSGVQFMLTDILVNFSMLALSIVVANRPADLRWLRKGCIFGLVIVSSYSFGQWVLANRGDTRLYNPWGSHQYLHQYDVGRYLLELRATGFYLEPSFDALVISVLAFALLRFSVSPTTVLIIAAPGIVSTQSVAGFAALAVAFLYSLVKPQADGRKIGARGLVLTVIAALAIFPSANYIVGRLQTLSQSGTSASYRISEPLQVLKAVLLHHPLGEPLGSVQSVIAGFDIYNGAQAGTSLDNGLYLIIFYFGWLGLFALIAINVTVVVVAARRRRPDFVLVAAFAMVSLLNTGGIFTPEFTVLAVIAVLSFKHEDGVLHEPSSTTRRPATVRRHGGPEQQGRFDANRRIGALAEHGE